MNRLCSNSGRLSGDLTDLQERGNPRGADGTKELENGNVGAKNTFIFLMPGEFQKCRSPARALEGRGGGCKGTAVERSGSRVFGGVQNIYDGHSGGGWSSLIPHGLAFCSPRQWRSSERSAGAHDAPECLLKPSNSAAFGSLEVADRREGG